MKRYPSLLRRTWRMQAWNPNPLMRVSYRWQSLLRMLIVIAMMIAVPVAGAIGTTTYTRTADRIAADNAAKTSASAVLLSDPVQTATEAPALQATYQAPVRWIHNGSTGTGTVDVPGSAKTGSTIQIWLAGGKPTTAPVAPGTAVWNGIGTALAVLAALWLAAIAVLWCSARALDHLRGLRWEAEWRSLSRPIGT